MTTEELETLLIELRDTKRTIENITLLSQSIQDSASAIAKERDELRAVLYELYNLMEGVIDGSYEPDSFTLQPARTILGIKK